MGYITPQGVAGLQRYVYKGRDDSLLYAHVLSPWAAWCVDHLTPVWLAPNTITLIGLVLQAIAYVWLAYYSPTFSESCPPLAIAFAGAALFAYSTLDNMDGKQARKVGASSPLGLLFDHGCDAVNTGMIGTLTFVMATGADASTWKPYALWMCTTTGFFFNTWEEFHLGEFILPIINGPSEGLMMSTALFFVTALSPAGMWASKTQLFTFVEPALAPVVNWFRAIAGQPLEAHITNLELCITFSVVFMMFTAIFNVYNVMVHLIKQHGFVKAWFYIPSCRAVVSASPHVFYATAGAIFANYTSKLMVSHVCDLDYKPSHIETAYFLLTPVVMFMLHTGVINPSVLEAYISMKALPMLGLRVACGVAVAQLLLFFTTSVRDISKALDIDVFSSAKQRARAAARAAAAAAAKAK